MTSPLSPEAKDALYNFTCPGCRMRRNKRAARVITSDAAWADGVRILYCQACADAIEHDAPMPKLRGNKSIEDIETRGKPPRTAQ